MSEFKLIIDGNDPEGFLKLPLTPVVEPMTKVDILRQMVGVMKKNDGIGLTASQVGLTDRMFVMMLNNDSKKQSYPLFVINPVIEKIWPKKNMNKEGCLSYPGVQVSVARPIDIMVRFHDGRTNRRLKLNGLDARVFLHEYDHCEGECIISRLSKLEKNHKGVDIATLNKKAEKEDKERVDNNKNK